MTWANAGFCRRLALFDGDVCHHETISKKLHFESSAPSTIKRTSKRTNRAVSGDPHVHSLPARHLAHLELLVGGADEGRRDRHVRRISQSNDDLQDCRRQRPEHLLSRGGPEQRARDPAAAWLSVIVPDVRYADALARGSLSPDRARLSRLRK